MPSCTSLVRLLRRRLVLGLIFALSLTYCAFSLLRNEKKGLSNLDNDPDMDPMMINDNNEDPMPDDNTLEELRASDKSPLWQVEILDQAANDNAVNMDASNLNESDVSPHTCRNSIQGRGLIVDDRGVVCSRHEVLSNGCCIEQRQTSKNEESLSVARRERYSCKTCNPQGCCTIYEYCVSCCLHPDKQTRSRKDVLSGSVKVQRDGRMPIRNSDRFQICLAACRTSSSSVRHENTYKDPLAKHCYISQRSLRNINSLNHNGDNPTVAVVVTSSSVVTLLVYSSPEYYPYLPIL